MRWVSLLGLVVFVALAWALSSDRRRFPWRTVWTGLALQLVLALVVLKTGAGKAFFAAAQMGVGAFLAAANEGAVLVFGPLGDPALLGGAFPARPVVLAVTITATIILVSSVSAVLYHWGLLQRVVRGMAWVMRRTMGLSGSESLAAAANVFMGQTEAPLLVRPYLRTMTRSELMALMSGGMATIAGGVMAVYVGLGIDAGHLLTASLMSAPAALLMAKIMVPETAGPPGKAELAEVESERAHGSLDALCRGAGEGMRLSLNVLAMLVAFTAIVALVNLLLTGAQRAVGVTEAAAIQDLLGLANAPFAWLIGIAPEDVRVAGSILGERIVLNEFIGFLSLSDPAVGGTLSPRSQVLMTYALCGFANFASVAIQVGGIGHLEPNRRADLARLGPRAMAAGLLASYGTAAMVGFLI